MNYCLLESVSIDKPISKVIYLMTPTSDNEMYRVGRAIDQEVRINDISSSRYHAQMKFDGKSFSIKDNMSKFGTLVEVKS